MQTPLVASRDHCHFACSSLHVPSLHVRTVVMLPNRASTSSIVLLCVSHVQAAQQALGEGPLAQGISNVLGGFLQPAGYSGRLNVRSTAAAAVHGGASCSSCTPPYHAHMQWLAVCLTCNCISMPSSSTCTSSMVLHWWTLSAYAAAAVTQ